MLKPKKYITEDENDDDYNDELVFIKKVLNNEAKPEEYEAYNDYASTLKSESGAIKGKTLFIGSGPYPVSPIILHNFGVNVDGMDYSGEAVEISKQVLKKMNLNIPIFQADGTTYKGYGNYDTIIVALEAGNTVQLKEAILNNISSQVDSHTNILVRSSNTSMFVNVADYLTNNFNIISKIPIFSGMSTTFVVSKKMVENIIKLNKKQLSETIERVINNLLFESDEQKIREHNYLVSLIKKYNSTPTNKTNIRRELFKQIQNKSKILGYNVGSEGNNVIVVNNDKPIKTIGVRRPQEEINNHKTLGEYSTEFQEFVNTLLKTGGLGVHKLDIGTDPEQAQRNIIQNKKTVVANTALDSLENMFNSGIIKIKATPHSQSERVPIDEYLEDITHDDFDYAFKQMVGENKNIKKQNIMKINKTKLQETVEKIVGGLLKEAYDYQIDNDFQNDDLDYPGEQPNRNNDLGKFEYVDWGVLYRDLLNNYNLVYKQKEPYKAYAIGDFLESINKTELGVLEDGDLIYMVNGSIPVLSDDTIDYQTFYSTAKNLWNKALSELIIGEATYSFKSDDPQLQQKTQKLQSDSTLFNKDKDEIKIDTTNESTMTGGQFMKMVNEAKAIRDKNGDYVKAVKKADRETEYDEKGPGWSAKHKIHKNDKKYDRKSFKKSEIIEMFKENKLNEWDNVNYNSKPDYEKKLSDKPKTDVGNSNTGDQTVKLLNDRYVGETITYVYRTTDKKVGAYELKIKKVKKSVNKRGEITFVLLLGDNNEGVITYNITRDYLDIWFNKLIINTIRDTDPKFYSVLNPTLKLGNGGTNTVMSFVKFLNPDAKDAIYKRLVNDYKTIMNSFNTY